MVETQIPPAPPPGPTAGTMLRAARERQGLHIAALGATIKVPVAKLEALESDRYELLPDVAFTRALAQTMCRALKIDPQPVLARLPHADPSKLDQVAGTLNTPFRERSGPDLPSLDLRAVRPMAWGGALLLIAAAVVFFLPSGVWQTAPEAPEAADAVPEAAATSAETAVAPEAAAQPAAPDVAAASEPAPPVAAAEPAAPAAAPLVQLRAEGDSWVQAQDATGRTLLSRLVRRGEAVDLDGPLPIRLTIGNAESMRLAFRGRPFDLAPVTRNAVARVELK